MSVAYEFPGEPGTDCSGNEAIQKGASNAFDRMSINLSRAIYKVDDAENFQSPLHS